MTNRLLILCGIVCIGVLYSILKRPNEKAPSPINYDIHIANQSDLNKIRNSNKQYQTINGNVTISTQPSDSLDWSVLSEINTIHGSLILDHVKRPLRTLFPRLKQVTHLMLVRTSPAVLPEDDLKITGQFLVDGNTKQAKKPILHQSDKALQSSLSDQ